MNRMNEIECALMVERSSSFEFEFEFIVIVGFCGCGGRERMESLLQMCRR